MMADHCDVLIIGGGPCGLMLANELGRRGVRLVLVDAKPGTAFNPQANATQARTMEHFRRLGFADEIRSLGLPPEFPTDIAYFTRFAGHELARFALPSASQARDRASGLTGSWSAAEMPHRVSQKFVEAVLRRQAERLPGVSIHYGFRLVSFNEHPDRVEAVIEHAADGRRHHVRSRYLVGADGPRSSTRAALGFSYQGETGTVRDFMGGPMQAIYVRAPAFYQVVPHAPAWMNVAFNQERRAFMAAVDGKGEFAFHTQLKAFEKPEAVNDASALAMFQAAVGVPIAAEILSRGTWTAGHALVADGFQRRRVFLAGDAVHLFTPTGGLGYNTAIEDAVNLGWKLAATLQGYGGPALLSSYQTERRPLALRNTSFARQFADSLGTYQPVAEIEADSLKGAEARRAAGHYFDRHARAEFNIPGITFGGRYDGSPIIASDGSRPPTDSANSYTPTACPGGRPPHAWIADNKSLFDMFGPGWTLLRLGHNPPQCDALRREAQRIGAELTVVDVADATVRDLYEADLALIRPDQIVAWRGDAIADATQLMARVTGH